MLFLINIRKSGSVRFAIRLKCEDALTNVQPVYFGEVHVMHFHWNTLPNHVTELELLKSLWILLSVIYCHLEIVWKIYFRMAWNLVDMMNI